MSRPSVLITSTRSPLTRKRSEGTPRTRADNRPPARRAISADDASTTDLTKSQAARSAHSARRGRSTRGRHGWENRRGGSLPGTGRQPRELLRQRQVSEHEGFPRSVELNASFYRWPRDSSFQVVGSAFAGRLHHVGEGTSRIDPRCGSCTGRSAGWNGSVAVGTNSARPRGASRPASCWPGPRRRAPGVLPSCVPGWVRVAVEFRHHSWHDDDGVRAPGAIRRRLLRGQRCGLPCVLRATAPFVYIRLHGPDRERLYAGSYSEADLGCGRHVAEWRTAGRDVYAYFNNDGDGNAVHNARRLNELTAS